MRTCTGGHSFYEFNGSSYDSPEGDSGALTTYTAGTTTYCRYTAADAAVQDFEHAVGTAAYYLTSESSYGDYGMIDYSDTAGQLDTRCFALLTPNPLPPRRICT